MSTEPITDLTYEQARAELDQIVTELEQGTMVLADVITNWERGEALVAYCREHLTGVRGRIDAAVAAATEREDEDTAPF